MAKKMLIDATHPEETRVVVVDGNRVEEFDYESITKLQIAGNIYLAKVTRVEPALHAAFVDYGGNRHGFLAFAEIHPDYYQIPVADREALIAAERAEAEREARREARLEASRSDNGDDEAEEDDASENEPERNDRRRGRRRQRRRGRNGGGRGERLALAPLSEAEAVAEGTISGAENGAWISAPELDLDAVDSEADENTPDLSDVTEIEIRRMAEPEEFEATGEAVVTQTIILPGAEETSVDGDSGGDDAAEAAQAAQTLSEDAGVALRDTLRGAPIVETDNEPETDDDAPAETAENEDQDDGEDDDADDGIEEIRNESDDANEDDVDEDAAELSDADDEEDGETGDEDGEEANARSSRGRGRGRRNRRGRRNDSDEDDNRPSRRDIEEIGADDARDEIRPRTIRMRDYKIQEVIKRRQIMLVQVVKEERGNKGAALTTYLSLAGRYCVLMPNTARGGGISRKITNAADRKRLKAVAQELDVPEGMGLIIRTAGANRTKAEIKRDYEYLLRQWSAIRDLTLSSIAPTLIYEEGSLIKRAIRDLYNRDIDAVLVEGEEGYREAKDYMKMLMPSHAKNVQSYRDQTPLFIRYQVESQMSAMLQPTVQLKSGGYIVIGVTEALVAIDVNSGRSTKENSIEETALKTNLEAAEEVARQLKLRDLAGLIVIDFIDMEEPKNNRAVEKRLKDKLKTDRARIQVGRISGFGLLEMSRQRLRPGLLETTTVCCPHCKGSGVIRSEESMALSILRSVEEEALKGRSPAFRVAAPVSVANYLINQKRARIGQIEARYGVQVMIDADPMVISPDFVLEKVKPVARESTELRRAVQIEAGFEDDYEDEDEIEDASVLEDDAEESEAEARSDDDARDDEDRGRDENGGRKRRRRRRRGDGQDSSEAGENAEAEDERAEDDADSDEAENAADADGDEGSGKKRRGRRGGRRRRRGETEAADADPLPVIDLDASDDDGSDDGETSAPEAKEPETAQAEKAAASDEAAEAGEPADEAEKAQPAAKKRSGERRRRKSRSKTEDETVAADAETDTIEPPLEVAAAEAPELTLVAQQAAPAESEDSSTRAQPAAAKDDSPAASRAKADDGPRRTGWWAFRRGA